MDLRRWPGRHQPHRAAGAAGRAGQAACRLRGGGDRLHGRAGLCPVRARTRPGARGRAARLDRRHAVCQPERRPVQGLLQRRHVGRAAEPAGARAGPAGGVTHVVVRLQGPRSRRSADRQGTGCVDGARGQRATGERPGPDHRAAHRCAVRDFTSGRRPTTASWRMSSRCRTRSRRRSSTSCGSSLRRPTSSSRSARRPRRRTSRPTNSTCRAARSGSAGAPRT